MGITIAVFSDFQCPYCARFAAMMKEVPPAEADKVRLVFHEFPLPMHPWARPAAEAAACAQEQGNSYFWALHDFMFDQQKDLNRDNLLGKLADVTKGLTGFDQGKFAISAASPTWSTWCPRTKTSWPTCSSRPCTGTVR